MSSTAGSAIIASYSGSRIRLRWLGRTKDGFANTATHSPRSVIGIGRLDAPARRTEAPVSSWSCLTVITDEGGISARESLLMNSSKVSESQSDIIPVLRFARIFRRSTCAFTTPFTAGTYINTGHILDSVPGGLRCTRFCYCWPQPSSLWRAGAGQRRDGLRSKADNTVYALDPNVRRPSRRVAGNTRDPPSQCVTRRLSPGSPAATRTQAGSSRRPIPQDEGKRRAVTTDPGEARKFAGPG